jgi:hypothetical protein
MRASGLAELRTHERELEQQWYRLLDDGHGYTGARALADEKQDDEERARSLAAAGEAQEAFLARLDDFQRRLHAHFMEQVLRELARAIESMRGFYGRTRMRRIERRYRQLERLGQRYRELEPDYGSERDHQRIAVYQRFYAGVVAFSARIRALDPTTPRPAPGTLVDGLYRVRRGVVWLARRSGALVRLVVAFVRAVVTACRKRQPDRGTPFTNRVDDLFRAWGDVCGYDVEVTGAEHLASDRPDAVSLYTPAHRHGVSDNVTFSQLRLSDYLVFNAVDQLPLLPRFLKQRVARTNGLIAVGGGRGSSVERALEALAQDVSHNVLIYPEGSVSEGFRGTRPPRAGFGERLARGIRAAGHALRIVPITYLDNARFLDLPPRSHTASDRRLRVVVSPALEPAAVDALLEAGGGAMLNRMVRLAWLENLATDDTHLLGLDRVAEIERRLDRELDGIRYWGCVESAPVPDRLAIPGDEPIAVHEEPFRGKRVRVLRIPESAVDDQGRIPLPDLARPDSHELLIGIRAPSHIYLNVGSRRFDGDIFRRLKVKQRDYVYRGILIRFRGIPVKSLNAIRNELERYAGREQRTLTCANSACKVIARAANLRIDDHADLRPFLPSHVLPTRTVRKLIERGVRNQAGDPVEVEIYKTDDRPLEAILAEARREEIRIARDHLRMLGMDGLRAAGAGLRRGARALGSALRSGRRAKPTGDLPGADPE